ncbi:aryl-alcohol dehydrogenase-like predicted oxidoreductase [Nocardioides zeae]|uniref:Aryl-alcohol dehydrogenase-like predicted oxidoreductase n=1 Tax=Nocardioides zeae TaxID=1457234 RepID=A0AAJ1X0Y3_9ACTN|nr:aryl-alcohol dehydrogenase-like predicted oxidoreductase [Nocardioides zeae]
MVSEIGLGTWQSVATASLGTAERLVLTALDSGVTLIDTAESYGTAPEALGRVLRPADRDRCVLSTKVAPVQPWQGEDAPSYAGALTPASIRRSVESSLRALRTDRVDLLSAHRYDPATPLEDVVRAMGEQIAAGTVLHWGVSEWTSSQLNEAVAMSDALGVDRPVSNQCQHSILWRVPESEVAAMCVEHGIGEVAFWSLAQGILSGKYLRRACPPPRSRAAGSGRATMDYLLLDPVLDRVQLFVELARRRGVSPAQLALAWVLSRPVVSATVVGASTSEQVLENVGAAEGMMVSDRTWELVDRIFAGCINDDIVATV